MWCILGIECNGQDIANLFLEYFGSVYKDELNLSSIYVAVKILFLLARHRYLLKKIQNKGAGSNGIPSLFCEIMY